MDKIESITWLDSLINHEKGPLKYKWEQYDVSRLYNLLRDIFPGIQNLKIIHVAGTKGKGSTSRYFYKALRQKGYKTGLFTSPHLFRFNERIRIQQDITDDELTQLIMKFKKVIEAEGLTYFEALTFLAMAHFLENGCEWVVLETGLGGRLDSTNFHPQPALCVITPISFDHTAILGKTIPEIAAEKAGIIKSGCPVLSLTQDNSALEIIRKTAQSKQASFYYLPEQVSWNIQKRSAQGAHLSVSLKDQEYIIQLRQIGDAYVESFLAALQGLAILGIRLNNQELQQLAEVRFPYHIQIEGNKVIDVSHNDSSIRLLLDTLHEYLGAEKYDLCIGILKDKELQRVAELLTEYRSRINSLQIFDFESDRPSGGKAFYELLDFPGSLYRPSFSQVLINENIWTVFTGSFYSIPVIASRLGLPADAAF